mmetsp:Transcript_3063/g.7904  ORF Transcript_3063/g.7904 Transcript_3063/m.7904 type:complete len:178 (+) Transcript_3063:204-737(+)
MVHEPAPLCSSHRPGYWLPAGRVDAGETFVQAGERETLEEAGIEAQVTGVLRFQLSKGVPRIVLYAEPRSADPSPKSLPDFESCGATWVRAEHLASLSDRDYRSDDPADLFPAIAKGVLPPQPIDTPAFKALEELIQVLTQQKQSGRETERVMAAVWQKLKQAYPRRYFLPKAQYLK